METHHKIGLVMLALIFLSLASVSYNLQMKKSEINVNVEAAPAPNVNVQNQLPDTAGAFVQGPNRVVVYQNYLLLDANATSNVTALAETNGSSSTWSNTTLVDPDYPRNVVLTINMSAAVTNGGYATVKGYDLTGDLRTENITVPSTGTGTGNIPFINLTNITWYNFGATEQVRAGYGLKFGLPNLITRVSDVLGVTIASEAKAVNAQTINLTYNTIQFSVAPNAARDHVVFYRGYGVIPP